VIGNLRNSCSLFLFAVPGIHLHETHKTHSQKPAPKKGSNSLPSRPKCHSLDTERANSETEH
jgi:hypothetical protein